MINKYKHSPAPVESVGEDEEFNRIIDNLTAASTPAHRGYAEANLIAHIDSLLAAKVADAPDPVKSVGEDATRAINGILRVVDADKTGDLHLLLGDDIETLTNCIDSLLAARTVADAPAGWRLVPIEPTEAMCEALTRYPQKHPQIREEYRAMLAAAPVAADQPAHDVSVRDAERFQFMMDWQEHNDQPEEILVMWRKVYAENRVKPTRAEYEAAIDEAIHALRSQPAQQGDSNGTC